MLDTRPVNRYWTDLTNCIERRSCNHTALCLSTGAWGRKSCPTSLQVWGSALRLTTSHVHPSIIFLFVHKPKPNCLTKEGFFILSLFCFLFQLKGKLLSCILLYRAEKKAAGLQRWTVWHQRNPLCIIINTIKSGKMFICTTIRINSIGQVHVQGIWLQFSIALSALTHSAETKYI